MWVALPKYRSRHDRISEDLAWANFRDCQIVGALSQEPGITVRNPEHCGQTAELLGAGPSRSAGRDKLLPGFHGRIGQACAHTS